MLRRWAKRGPPLLCALLGSATEKESARASKTGRSPQERYLAVASLLLESGASANALCTVAVVQHAEAEVVAAGAPTIAAVAKGEEARQEASSNGNNNHNSKKKRGGKNGRGNNNEAAAGGGNDASAPSPSSAAVFRSERSLLEVCCMAGNAEAVQMLLRNGATTSGLALGELSTSAVAHGHGEIAKVVREAMNERAEAAMQALVLEDEEDGDGGGGA